MRARPFALLLALTACGEGSADLAGRTGTDRADRLDPARGVLFPDSSAAGLLDQCSRPVPTGVVGYWTPDSAQVAALEAALEPVLAEELERALPEKARIGSEHRAPRPSSYYRQYGGLTLAEGRRIIYVNGFHEGHVESRAEFLKEHGEGAQARGAFPPGFRNAGWWRGVAGGVCDGAWYYFGAEYDPRTGRIGRFHFNGHA